MGCIWRLGDRLSTALIYCFSPSSLCKCCLMLYRSFRVRPFSAPFRCRQICLTGTASFMSVSASWWEKKIQLISVFMKSHRPIRHSWWLCKMSEDLFKTIRHIVWSSDKTFLYYLNWYIRFFFFLKTDDLLKIIRHTHFRFITLYLETIKSFSSTFQENFPIFKADWKIKHSSRQYSNSSTFQQGLWEPCFTKNSTSVMTESCFFFLRKMTLSIVTTEWQIRFLG